MVLVEAFSQAPQETILNSRRIFYLNHPHNKMNLALSVVLNKQENRPEVQLVLEVELMRDPVSEDGIQRVGPIDNKMKSLLVVFDNANHL